MNLSKYNPIVARFLFALLFGYAATQAHACDCNKAADRAKYPAQCGIMTPETSNASQTQSANSNASSASNAAARSASQSGANAAGGSVGTVASGSAASVGNVAASGGSGGTGGSANSTASGGAGGSAMGSASSQSGASSNAQVSTYEASRIPANTALAAMGITTAGCRFAEGVGIQLIPGGTSVGITLKDHDCVRFQIAQFFYSRGNDLAGDHVICQIAEVRKDLGDDCLAYLAQEHAPADAVTHSELRELEKRIESRTLAK